MAFRTKRINFRFLLLLSTILSSLSSGHAGLTSAYVRSERPSVDIPLDNEAFAAPEGPNTPQQVHITQGDYDGKAVIVSWVTPDEPGLWKLQYGKSKDFKLSAESTMTNYTFNKYNSGYIHHCLLDGLEYNTKYYYKIEASGSSREFWFQTPPKIHPDAPYTFGIIGKNCDESRGVYLFQLAKTD